MKRTSLKRTSAFLALLLLAASAVFAFRQDFSAFAKDGERLAKTDPLSIALRDREPNGDSRRGFFIGLAVAEGHTEYGPGKDATRAKLKTTEQAGFDRGVLFSIDRNRNAALAKVGAAMAKGDPAVRAARIGEDDPFFWLGFDIGIGIFGDPKKGAKGNTATGPGSIKIRDGLGAISQRGFNASLRFRGIPVPPSAPAPAPAPGKIDPNATFSQIARSNNSSLFLAALKAPFISDVQVVPDSRNVVISFMSTQVTPPLIEIAKVPPKPDRFGIIAFGFNSGAFVRFAPAKKNRFVLDVDVQGEQLDIGTTYYYIINVFNDVKNDTKRPREQVTGQFTTLSQSVRVVWERILLEDDSDDLSTGECDFWFWANHGQASGKSESYSNGDMDSGHNYYPDKSVTLYNASDQLSLAASGQEDDAVGAAFREDLGTRSPLTGPSNGGSYDVNVAFGTFDLTKHPGEKVKVPFQLNSMPGGDLKFVIFGYFEITRERR